MIIYISISIFLAVLVIAYLSIVRKKHGYVEFRTGLLLKLLPELKGSIDLLKLRRDYKQMALKRVGKLKIKTDRTIELRVPTRHGDVKARAFISNGSEEKPLIVFFHGGGFCIGDIDTHTEQCTRIALESGMSVISIDYSLSPEYAYPRALEECSDCALWICEKTDFDFGDQSRLVLMGDSAGGWLSIMTALRMKKEGLISNICEVVPVYPVTDYASEKTGSFVMYNTGYFLTGKLMDSFDKAYMSNLDLEARKIASPLLVQDLSDFPDTYLITADFDPLRDEGEAFARKLKSQGVNVTSKRYKGTIHEFFGISLFGRRGIKAVEDLGHYLKHKY